MALNNNSKEVTCKTDDGVSVMPPPPLLPPPRPPIEYICPICLTLMSDPVSFADIIADRLCIETSFKPSNLEGTPIVADQTLKSRINRWRKLHGRLPPPFPSFSGAREASAVIASLSSFNREERMNTHQETSPTLIENIIKNLVDSETLCRQDALNALAEYTNPKNGDYVCHKNLLDPILTFYFKNHPSSTAAATALLYNISKHPSNHYYLTHHSGALPYLLATLNDKYGCTPTAVRDKAARTLCRLASEVENKTEMAFTGGVMHSLAGYMLNESSGGSQRGRESAGMTLVKLVMLKFEENAFLLLMLNNVMERVLKLAKDERERCSRVRRTAFRLISIMAETEHGRKWLVERRIIKEMVEIMKVQKEEEKVKKWCLEVLWMSGKYLKGQMFKKLATEVELESVMKEMTISWGAKWREIMLELIWRIRKDDDEDEDVDSDSDSDSYLDSDSDSDVDSDVDMGVDVDGDVDVVVDGDGEGEGDGDVDVDVDVDEEGSD